MMSGFFARGLSKRTVWSPAMALAIAGLPIALSSAPAAAQALKEADHDHGLPTFDMRGDAEQAPTGAVRKAVAEARAQRQEQREADVAALRALAPLVAVDESPYYGTPSFVRSTAEFLTPAAKLDAQGVVSNFIAQYPGLFEISHAELASARVSRDFTTKHNQVRHLTYVQQIKGIELFQCEVRANVMADGRLINIGSTMLPRPEGDFVVKPATLTAEQAIAAAASACGVTVTEASTRDGAEVGPSQKQVWNNSPDFRADEPIVTELTYFAAARDDIRTAYKVLVPVKGIGHTYETVIDANSGELLWRVNRLRFSTTQPVTMRVYTTASPAPMQPSRNTPDGVQAPFVTRTLVTKNPIDVMAFSPNGWINDGGTDTQGNNVDAHSDLDGNNTPDTPRPNGGASRVFDFPLDTTQAPTTYTSAAIVQMFYLCNLYHDRLYAMGFDEAAGNFQLLNLAGQGGAANDRVQADVQDNFTPASGNPSVNNANFGTGGADGTTARCQMYVFTGPNPDRDGSLDADVVFHELTHGTSIRLHGGLTGVQPESMGEGWGDFVALSLSAEAGDDPDAPQCSGGYATYQLGGGVNNYYFGIRRFPYSTNLNVYPLTYADINLVSYDTSIPANPLFIGNPASEVHNAGEVWCNMLWEARAALMHDYGFAGNDRMLQLVIDGMAMSVGNPNFIQARDAILQADMANNGGVAVDGDRLWAAFAKRGLGFSAQSPNGTSPAGIVEGYDTPNYITFAYPNGAPTQLQPGVATVFPVTLTPHSLTMTPGTAQLTYSVDGGSAVTVPLVSTGGNNYTATLPAATCFDRVSYYVSVGTNGGVRTDPATAPTAKRSAVVYSAGTTIVNDGFETATPGWTVAAGTPAATSGAWNRGVPQATLAQPGSAHGGSNCWVTNGTAGASDGANDVDGGQTILTSPSFNLSGAGDAAVSYWRWYSNSAGGNPSTNTFLVQVSNNGGTWVTAETVGPAGPGTSGGWIQASWDLSSLGLAPTANVRVRFIAQDLTTALVEAAIDDFMVVARNCTEPTPTCGTSDFNGDGDFGTDSDIEAFFACLAGNCCPTCFTGGSDFNGDGDSGTDSDIEAFFRVLAGGNC